jgi:lipoprotein-anchoring transpeptidase ErfK/SrfK
MTEATKNREGVAQTTTGIHSIVVSLPKHEITISENGTVVRNITDFSTGRAGHLTPLIENGKIDPVRRERLHYSTLYKDKSGKSAAMPYALFFAGGSGCAFHAGDPDTESHGCIHLKMADAEWLFNWAGKHDVSLQILGPNPHVSDVKTA